jgi:hypothetical protein
MVCLRMVLVALAVFQYEHLSSESVLRKLYSKLCPRIVSCVRQGA